MWNGRDGQQMCQSELPLVNGKQCCIGSDKATERELEEIKCFISSLNLDKKQIHEAYICLLKLFETCREEWPLPVS